jgi:spore coat protein CotH
VHVNGQYYYFMMEYEGMNEGLIRKALPPDEAMGDLFKADGLDPAAGPYARSDGTPLVGNDTCKVPVGDVYAASWPRESNEWKNHDELRALLDGLKAARGAGDPARLRDFLERTFDVPQVLTYLAIRNWLGPMDDGYHNYFLYRRATGKWWMVQWDYDLDMGGHPYRKPTQSFTIGELGNPDNNPAKPPDAGGANAIKDAFFKTYRSEFAARLKELDRTILDPANVIKTIDEAEKLLSPADQMQAPAPPACNYAARVEGMRNWARQRREALRAQFP